MISHRIRSRALLLTAAVALSGCGPDCSQTKLSPEDRAYCTNRPQVAATTPSGIELWVWWSHDAGRAIYFSQFGTSTTHSETRGKVTVQVPDDVPSGRAK